MRAKHLLVMGFFGLGGVLPGAWHTFSHAQEGDPAKQSFNHAVRGESAVSAAPHTQGGIEEPHHSQRPAILPPEEDKAYSEFNHHVAGVFVFLAGGLALLATVGGPRYAWARSGWPVAFLLLGGFIAVRHDPESWPWGSLTFWESVTDAQVLQHMLFALIVLAIGAIEWLRSRGTLTHPAWGWVFPSLAVSAALMLFMHKHGEGPVAEKIYRHHVIMAVSGIVAMIAKVFDDARVFNSRTSSYVWTTLMMFVGFLLLIYTE